MSEAELDAVLVAVELALERAGSSGQASLEQVGNVLARLNAPPWPENVTTALIVLRPPQADSARHNQLRRLGQEEAAEQKVGDA